MSDRSHDEQPPRRARWARWRGPARGAVGLLVAYYAFPVRLSSAPLAMFELLLAISGLALLDGRCGVKLPRAPRRGLHE